MASHLTCVGSTVEELRAYLREAATARHRRTSSPCAATRPKAKREFRPVAGGLRYANELVALIRGEFPQFGIAVAGYPETHQEAPSPRGRLAESQAQGRRGRRHRHHAIVLRQRRLFRFRDRCAALGIRVPIVPGCPAGDEPGANPPHHEHVRGAAAREFVAELEAHDESAADQFKVGVEFATAQVQSLLDQRRAGHSLLRAEQIAGHMPRACGP